MPCECGGKERRHCVPHVAFLIANVAVENKAIIE